MSPPAKGGYSYLNEPVQEREHENAGRYQHRRLKTRNIRGTTIARDAAQHGPQHPGTHGIIRFLLTLEGETIVGCTPVMGYLHRGIEKVLENRPIMAGIRYMDNVDYLSPMLNEIAYVGAVEQVMGIEAPRRAQYIRLLVGELQRIAGHLVAVASLAGDLSALGVSPFVYPFREREGILSLFEQLGGSRFNVNYQRVGGVLHDFPQGWMSTCEHWLDEFEKNLTELTGLTLDNELFQLRMNLRNASRNV